MSQAKNEPPPAAAAPVIVQLTSEQLEQMLTRIMAAVGTGKPPDSDTMMALESLKASVAATQLLGDEFKRTVRRSNADHRHQSVFDFDIRCDRCKAGDVHVETGTHAHQKAQLRHETYFCWGRQDEESLTPVEVELFNSFNKSTEARDGTWTATLERFNSKKQRLHITVPCATIDDLASLPPLEQILMELLFGKEVVDPVISSQRIKDLEERLRQNEEALAALQAKQK